MFHVGGIHRNLLAPLLAGSAVVFMRFFEPRRFWVLMGAKGGTWYHGVPSIHAAIVDALLPPGATKAGAGQAADRRLAAGQAYAKTGVRLRFVTNAGAALPHAQALELRAVYPGADVLPCYGMSECAAVAAPPRGYDLDAKPGSVGRPVGPALKIAGPDGAALPPGQAGEVCIRGPPTFPGYINLATGELQAMGSTDWFSTGDMGKLDEDGYLFLTGRSKEVINRGGEIISPIEVEEVFLKHPAITAAAAFVVPHATLQEAVGLMVVVKPGCPRPSKAQLVEWSAGQLGPPKWPVNVVYTPRLPLSSAGKMVRIGLAERLGLPDNANESPDLDCHFEVTSVPDAKLLGNKAPIPCRPLPLDAHAVEDALRSAFPYLTDVAAVERRNRRGARSLVVYAAPAEELPPSAAVLEALASHVHGYTLPSAAVGVDKVPRDASGALDVDRLPDPSAGDYVSPSNEYEEAIQKVWHEVLGVEGVGVRTDFFAAGGASIQAGAVGYSIRALYGVPANGALLYDKRTIAELAEYVASHVAARTGGGAAGGHGTPQQQYFDDLPAGEPDVSSTHWLVQAVHWTSIPLVSMCTTFTHWMALMCMICLMRELIESRIVALVLASALTSWGMSVYRPLLAIAVKWVVVGRFRPGRYPLWGSYYLRWWLADQFRRAGGLGAFGKTPALIRTYYRLMGARIGARVIIDPSAVLGEFDLLELGDDALVDAQAVLCPGVADCGDLLLAPISVGAGSAVGKKCLLAPGAILPKDTAMRPCTSSWELHLAASRYRPLCKPRNGDVPWWPLAPLGMALQSLPEVVALAPVLAMLYYRIDLILPSAGMWQYGIRGLLDWLLQPQWMLLFLVSKVIKACISPFLKLATVVALKATVFRGCFRLGPLPPRHSRAALGRWWLQMMFTDGLLCGVAPLINVHSELHSALLRLLGAKVGRHVFWPLSGLVTPYHDYVECGDDVIWGAHHALIVSDDVGVRPIVLEAGANPLDRVVLSPGVRVCRNALVGTGSFVEPGVAVPAGSKWLGTAVLETSEQRAAAPSAKPYSRACEGGAAYFHVRDWMWPFILLPLKAAETVMTKSPVLLALLAADICTRHFHDHAWYDYPPAPPPPPMAPSPAPPPPPVPSSASLVNGDRHGVPLAEFFLVLAAFYMTADLAVKLAGVWLDIAAKWVIIGRRVAGPHPFDKSSYSQRWHFYLSFHGFSKAMLERWVGTSMVPWYFRQLGCTIGKNVCFLQGVTPMFSREPDLTTIGDNVCVNLSIIRCHSNALGIFELQPCVLGHNVTLRSGAVVQGGARLQDNSVMLERTLAMPGEIVNSGMAMQGWPADVMVPARIRQHSRAAAAPRGSHDPLTTPLLGPADAAGQHPSAGGSLV